MKGAAVVLSHSSPVVLPARRDCGGSGGAGAGEMVSGEASSSSGGGGVAQPPSQAEIQTHLTAMLGLLRPEDTLRMAVRLESSLGGEERTRYMAIVSTTGRQDNTESAILGIDYSASPPAPQAATIGLVLPIFTNTAVALDGEGSIKLALREPPKPTVHHVFKPVSVQAMWSAFQSLVREAALAQDAGYHDGGLTHTWLGHYAARVRSPEAFRAEWNFYLPLEDHETTMQADSLRRFQPKPPELQRLHDRIRQTLKDIMQSVDLDEVNTRDIRLQVERELAQPLGPQKAYFDQEMMTILGQMEKPSQIFPYLYLGTEWNASNWDELGSNNVTHILNVTKEVDNFFQSQFNYMKIAVSDEASSELLQYWNECFRFICAARTANGAVLVHCKKGISRSSSTVIAFAMKEYGWDLDTALEYVKEKRNCITPNQGFMRQLKTYQGILDASRNRNSALWNNQDSPLGTAASHHELEPTVVSPTAALQACPSLDELRKAPTRTSSSSASSIIYSDKSHHSPAATVPTLVAMSSGNILKPGRQSRPSSEAPSTSNHTVVEEEDADEGADHLDDQAADDQLPASLRRRRSQSGQGDDASYFRSIRPPLRPHILARLERSELEDGAPLPLNRLQKMVVSSRAARAAGDPDLHNLSSSSGVSCSSQSSSSTSLDDDGKGAKAPASDASSTGSAPLLHRRNSKSSSGDSALDEERRQTSKHPARPPPPPSSRLKQAKQRLLSALTMRETSKDDEAKGPKSKWLRNLNRTADKGTTGVSPSPSLSKVGQGTVKRTKEQLEKAGKGPFLPDLGSERHILFRQADADGRAQVASLAHARKAAAARVGGEEKIVRSLVKRFDPARPVAPSSSPLLACERERRRTVEPGMGEEEMETEEGGRFQRTGSLSSAPPPTLATPIISRAMSLTFDPGSN